MSCQALGVIYVSAVDTKVDLGRLWTGLPRALALFGKMWPPDWAYVQTVLPALADTIRMAVLGTLVGAVLALPFIILGARNLTRSGVLVWFVRVGLNLIRTVPDMLWAAIFVAALGIGPLPGVGALAAFSFGIIAKLTSESVEVIDAGPLEAMQAVGANPLHKSYQTSHPTPSTALKSTSVQPTYSASSEQAASARRSSSPPTTATGGPWA